MTDHLSRFLRFLMTLVAVTGACLSASSVQAETQSMNLEIGVIVPLTGPNSSIGRAIQNGLKLAVSEHPELLAKVQFDFQDSQLAPKQAAAAYQLLVGEKKLQLLFVSGNAETLSLLAEAGDAVLLIFGADSDAVEGAEHVLRSTSSEGPLSADEIDQKFRRRYRRIYGTEADVGFAANAYDMATLVAAHLELGSRINPSEIIDALMSASPRDGVMGHYVPATDRAGQRYFRSTRGPRDESVKHAAASR